ncbi:MAG: hypothetical protein WCD76_06835 [Pyrinomonadaceae bacterium]
MAKTKTEEGGGQGPPQLRRDAQGRVEPSSLADLIAWFLQYDPRVAVINYPAVEALFQWKQRQTLDEHPDAYAFDRAEDRLAVGIAGALAENGTKRELHDWITDLLGALDDATKTNEAIAAAYGLHPTEEISALDEAAKIPASRERDIYLNCCWLETLCTAEIRVLGWAYRQLYGEQFSPQS